MSHIENTALRISVGSAALLLAGLAVQIGGLYVKNISTSNMMAIMGRVGSYVGGVGLGIALPIYVLKKAEKDPAIYKKVLIASLVGVIAGAVLTGVNTGHSASHMIGRSLLTLSGGMMLTILFYYMLYGKTAESSSAATQALQPPRVGGRPHRVGGNRLFRIFRRANQATERPGLVRTEQERIQEFQQASYKDRLTVMFGNNRPAHAPNRTVVPEGLEAGVKAQTCSMFNSNKRFLLMRNAEDHLLRISAPEYDSQDVTAEINEGHEWKRIDNWHPEHERIAPFLDFWKNRDSEAPALQGQPPATRRTQQLPPEQLRQRRIARFGPPTSGAPA